MWLYTLLCRSASGDILKHNGALAFAVNCGSKAYIVESVYVFLPYALAPGVDALTLTMMPSLQRHDLHCGNVIYSYSPLLHMLGCVPV